MEPAVQKVPTARRYRGVTASERRAQRRERLLDAGLEVFGTEGYASTSVRSLSAAASLNSRYFYESFASREELLSAVYRRIMADIGEATRDAIAGQDTVTAQARASLRAGWLVLTEDRRKARIVALEIVGVSESLELMRRQMRHALADFMVGNAMAVAGDDIKLRLDPVLVARFLMGGVVEMLVDWINGDVSASADEIVEHFTRLFTASAYAAVEVPAAAATRNGRPPAGKRSTR